MSRGGLLLALAFLCSATAALAERSYVTDVHVVPQDQSCLGELQLGELARVNGTSGRPGNVCGVAHMLSDDEVFQDMREKIKDLEARVRQLESHQQK